ncbi:MAG: membrane protein insertase YidC [Polyangiales bacterium]
MDRNTLSRILLYVSIFFLAKSGYDYFYGKKQGEKPIPVVETYARVPLPLGTPAGETCKVTTPTYEATVAEIGGGLSSFRLLDGKYAEKGEPMDLAHATSIDLSKHEIPEYTPLRTFFRNGAGEDQIPGDLLSFAAKKVGDACVLTHVTPGVVEVTRTLRPGAGPYELSIETHVKNLASSPKRHAFSTAVFGLQRKEDEGGFMQRPSQNALFQGACGVTGGGKLDRKDKNALEKEWTIQSAPIDFAALSTNYFGQAIVPEDTGAHCALVAQARYAAIDANNKPVGDPIQSLLRAVVAYPSAELLPNAEAVYKQTAFLGPKERNLLAGALGGRHGLTRLIDLGTFSQIAMILVAFLTFLHLKIGSWGIAIVLMTLTVRLSLAPLMIPQIKSSIVMQRLKPEIDVINAKYAEDPQAKMTATQALYKREGINPMLGCLPALLQMPIWLSLYTALQTAIELFHEKFFIWQDLSAPDPYFILPLVLGASMFIQQKVTPMQMDPTQAKIMLYFMPGMFMVFMLFLPAGLAMYSLTNSLLGITQTIVMQRYMKSQGGPPSAVVVKPSVKEDDAPPSGPRSARELARRR